MHNELFKVIWAANMEAIFSIATQADAALFSKELARENIPRELKYGPVTFDLIRAYRAAHALNDVFLDLSAAAFDLTIGDTQIGKIGEEVWTASLRTNVDGPGGVYVLVAPASMAWKMPSRDTSSRVVPIDIATVTQQISNALDMVAEVGVPIAIRMTRNQIMLLATYKATHRNQSVILTGNKVRKVPIALRIS